MTAAATMTITKGDGDNDKNEDVDIMGRPWMIKGKGEMIRNLKRDERQNERK